MTAGRPPWNKGLPRVPGAGSQLPVPDRHGEIVQLYAEGLSPQQIADRVLPDRPRHSGGQSVRLILRHHHVLLRAHREACLAFQQTAGGRRRGPRYASLR